MKFKGFLIAAFTAVMLCVNVFGASANPIVMVSCDGYEGSYSIEASGITKERDDAVLLFINGNIISEADAVIQNGTTLVPIRVIGESIGADITWDSDYKIITMFYDGALVQAQIGNSYIVVGGSAVSTSAPTQIINSMTYVPLRAVAPAFGAEVGYDGSTFSDADGTVQIVWVQTKNSSAAISKTEAEQIAKNTFFNDFLPRVQDFLSEQMLTDVGEITPENINSKFKYLDGLAFSCKADLGEYYYIRFFNSGVCGALIDKYDGSCYPVSGYSLIIFQITEVGSNSWLRIFI